MNSGHHLAPRGLHQDIKSLMFRCMRTTLTLDDHVAAMLRRLQRSRRKRLRELVNEALRVGLQMLGAPKRRRTPFRTREAHLGRCLIGSLDDVLEALAVAEGEACK